MIYAVVFITGASVLIVEIVATRILAPYYGNTIFTVSSVIGIILAALSCGYYIGGRLADRNPSPARFYGIILLGGLSVLILRLVVSLFMPKLGYGLSMVSGPLVSSIALFFLPAFLLGLLSPYAIKLQHVRYPDLGVGRISGLVFFWSTAGSILGCLAAGFLLIPHLGVNAILMTIGWALFILGGTGFAFTGRHRIASLGLCLLIALGISLVIAAFGERRPSYVIYADDGIYEKIAIIDQSHKGRPVRLLMQDLGISTGVFLDTGEMFSDYTKYYILHEIFTPNTKRVLAIGGGPYTVPREIVMKVPNATVDIAEIEPQLFGLAKEYFGLPDNEPRLINHVEDGRRFLHDSEKKYDLIFSDVYYSYASVPMHCMTQEFFQIALDKMNQDGLFVGNFVGSLDPKASPHLFSLIKTFRSVFKNSYLFATESPDSTDPQNFILVGYNSDRVMYLRDPKILNHSNPIIQNLHRQAVDLSRLDLSSHIVLTDDYAPVEALLAPLIEKFDRSVLSGQLRLY